MTEITIKINATVPENADPGVYAAGILGRLSIANAAGLEDWQPIYAAVGNDQIGECHFEIVEDEGDKE